jgi:catechol 1,2-dioxygenase
MATNGASVNGGTKHKYNPTFTQSVINATGPKATPRVRQLTASLIQHLHDFARENELTVDEWMLGVELVCSRDTISRMLAHTQC